MAISFIGSASNSAINGGSVTVTLPASMASNDLILYVAGCPNLADQTMTMTTTGYTQVADLFSSDTNTINLGLFYKFHNGTDTTAVWTGDGDAFSGNSGAVMVFRGVKLVANGGPFDVTSTTTTAINTILADPPSITTSGGAGIWTVIAAAGGYAGTGAQTYGAPTNYTTNFVTISGDDTGDSVVGMGYRTNPATTENPAALTFSLTDSVNNSYAAVTMALSPAAAAAAGFEGWGIPI